MIKIVQNNQLKVGIRIPHFLGLDSWVLLCVIYTKIINKNIMCAYAKVQASTDHLYL